MMKSLWIIIFVLGTAASTSAASSYQCITGIKRTTTVKGSVRTSLRRYALNEWCHADTLKECREELLKNLTEHSESTDAFVAKVAELGNKKLTTRLSGQPAEYIVDHLFSRQKVTVNINERSSVELGQLSFVDAQPIDKLYPNLESDFGEKKALRFRHSLGGGLTEDLDEILTFQQSGNYSTGYYPGEWYLKEIREPDVYTAIVGDQLVITLQDDIGKVTRTITSRIPVRRKLGVPFTAEKKIKGLNVKLDAFFTVECREI